MNLNRVSDCKYELEDLIEFQKALADAEQKVQILLKNAGKDELTTFTDDENN